VVGHVEPFRRLISPGVVLGENHEKMSKSAGNVVNPDDVVERYGADALRLFEMFMGPLEVMKPWSTSGVEGVHRFINRVWRLVVDSDGNLQTDLSSDPPEGAFLRLLHRTNAKVTSDFERLSFNTAIAAMMEFLNEAQRQKPLSRAVVETLVLLLAPLAPHVCEELWQRLGKEGLIARAAWPAFDPALTVEDVVEVAVQVSGKTRGQVKIAAAAPQADAEAAARADAGIARHLEGKALVKVVYVPGRILNFVVKG
jgi:leucyl-tRNA synthetase